MSAVDQGAGGVFDGGSTSVARAHGGFAYGSMQTMAHYFAPVLPVTPTLPHLSSAAGGHASTRKHKVTPLKHPKKEKQTLPPGVEKQPF